MAVVPQDSASPQGWTVEQAVAMGRSPHQRLLGGPTGEDARIVADAMQATGTAEFASRLVDTLSGGERQRVLLARALAQTPRVLLLDEPTASLDLQYQWDMLELVEEARRARGITVIAVLHDLNLAAAFSDRIALLSAGRVEALGAPEQVLNEALIEAVFGRRVSIGVHPATGRPTVLAWPGRGRRGPSRRVHVISGGGSGAAVLRRLVSDGHHVTAGVLNIGDTDWETARALGLEVAEERPFSSISEAARERALEMATRAEYVLVAPAPVGPGNLANLRVAVEAAQAGGRVLMVGAMDARRDFTHGAAAALWREAEVAGATPVPDTAAAVRVIESRKKEGR
jgi:iron complex transport system ATP-binding protein